MADGSDAFVAQRVQLRTTHCGEINVHILGDYRNVSQKAVFLSVHDFGSNAQSFDRFIFHDSMMEARSKSVWINFEVPGQGVNASDFPQDAKFPTLQEMGEDLVEVLNQLHIQYVIGFGEGAGANILTRFAMIYPTRVLGLLLIHPTATSAGFKEWFKDKMFSWKMKNAASPSAEDYLVLYKFGNEMERTAVENREQAIQQYLSDLRSQTNHKNLHSYMEAFLNRNDLTSQLRERLTCDCMIICGTRSSFQHTVVTMYTHLNPQKASLLKIDNVADVLVEAPEQVTRGLLLFCKGLGLCEYEGCFGSSSNAQLSRAENIWRHSACALHVAQDRYQPDGHGSVHSKDWSGFCVKTNRLVLITHGLDAISNTD